MRPLGRLLGVIAALAALGVGIWQWQARGGEESAQKAAPNVLTVSELFPYYVRKSHPPRCLD